MSVKTELFEYGSTFPPPNMTPAVPLPFSPPVPSLPALFPPFPHHHPPTPSPTRHKSPPSHHDYFNEILRKPALPLDGNCYRQQQQQQPCSFPPPVDVPHSRFDYARDFHIPPSSLYSPLSPHTQPCHPVLRHHDIQIHPVYGGFDR